MKRTKIIILFFLCGVSEKCFSQNFDSVHVYAIYMKSQYTIRIDKDIIRNEVEPIILLDNSQINNVYSVLRDTVKGGSVRKMKNNQLDIRLSFEFFKAGKVVQVMGFTSHDKMFINYTLYKYDKRSLTNLDRYINGLSKILGIKEEGYVVVNKSQHILYQNRR